MRAKRPRFSTYDFLEPEVPQQSPNSMDCGVWVCEWMIREALRGNYNVQNVDADNKMSVAVDLVLRPYNPIAGEVVIKALQHWKRKSTNC
ncbi:hypothetical protein PIB30_022941 [Stylosanthes scabra]|uniref:Ubiquitin-like protease family profile domain-containing protein n=1 Tax=Stylosanthes scabra TaxID=79078 RepID=A0ABU6R9J9_9FABA|nr:hypothetical protein [Stylosanthes scabra]